jgi:hypothetical protein
MQYHKISIRKQCSDTRAYRGISSDILVTLVTVEPKFSLVKRKHFIDQYPEIWSDMQIRAVLGITELCKYHDNLQISDLVNSFSLRSTNERIQDFIRVAKSIKTDGDKLSFHILQILEDVNPDSEEEYFQNSTPNNEREIYDKICKLYNQTFFESSPASVVSKNLKTIRNLYEENLIEDNLVYKVQKILKEYIYISD